MSLDPTFAEQLGLVIGAVATVITAVGGVALIRGRSETKHVEGPSQHAVLKAALDANTSSLCDVSSQMRQNNSHFQTVSNHVEAINRNTQDALFVARAMERIAIKLEDRSK